MTRKPITRSRQSIFIEREENFKTEPKEKRTENLNNKEIVWNQVLERIKKKTSPQVFFWFTPLKFLSQSEDKISLCANDQFERNWIIDHYSDFIKETINELYSKQIDVEIVCEEEEQQENPESKQNKGKQKKKKRSVINSAFSGFVNPNYTFDNFIVGPSNQFAHAASTAVAKKPGESYNPLFIYGGVGLGKTHLINAIGNYILKNSSYMARLCCVSAEHFTNQVINSIKANRMEEFRNRYRFGCDVLLIDDIQFLIGKESTQEEFFHTFNTLYESKKQIVLTSDKSPKEMSYLEERLRSRFEWGLLTDIQPPETETKIAIVKKKAESEGLVIPDDVATLIAQYSTTNIRELEGALTNIIAYAELLNSKISIDLAQEVLKNISKENSTISLSIEDIQKVVATFFKLTVQDLKSGKKQRRIVLPRQISMYLSRKYTSSSFPEIGDQFGGKDHSTVIHAVRKIDKLLDKDSEVRMSISTIARKIENLRGG